jgi:hypothetical protein
MEHLELTYVKFVTGSVRMMRASHAKIETAQQIEEKVSCKQDQKDDKRCVQSSHFQKWNIIWTSLQVCGL